MNSSEKGGIMAGGATMLGLMGTAWQQYTKQENDDNAKLKADGEVSAPFFIRVILFMFNH